MNEVYWNINPPRGIDPADATERLYHEFRNPVTHDLGIAIEYDRSTKVRQVKPRDLRFVVKKYERLTEESLELREVSL